MNVEFDGFGDNMRIYCQEDDEGTAFIWEQHVNCIKDRQDLKGTNGYSC